MATGAVPNNPNLLPNERHSLADTALTLFVGLAWGAVMLVVFGFWMRSKYEGRAVVVTNIFLLAGVCTALLAVWQAFTLWFKKESPEEKTATLGQQRRIFSFVLLGAGLGLIVMAFFLGIAKKPNGDYGFIRDNFAETFGVLLFGLIALSSGYLLQQPLGGSGSPIQFLVDKVPILKMSMLVLGVVCLLGFGIIFYQSRQPAGRGANAAELLAKGAEVPAAVSIATYLPELAALLFISMLCLGCFLWLNAGGFDEFGVRLFVLIFGGSLGMILFFASLLRAYLWRQDIILGGSAAWQGPDAWHFWLCAYVLFGALVLMYVSFNLARADIRTNYYLRVVMYGYETLVQGLLLIGALFILNIVVNALYPYSFEWTRNRGAYALSDASKNLIAGLKQETNIVVLLPQNDIATKDVRLLLENCQAISPKDRLKVSYVSPDADSEQYKKLADVFPAVFPEMSRPGDVRGVLVVFGPIPETKEQNVPSAFVGVNKLREVEPARRPGEKAKYTFKGEAEIFKELRFLIDKQKKRKIYILQGNDEVDMNDQRPMERRVFTVDLAGVGVGMLVEKLGNDNFDVSGLSFNLELGGKNEKLVYAKAGQDKKKTIPDDCQMLIVAGVAKAFSTEVLEAIERYLEQGGPDKTGGKMLVYFDVFVDPETNTLKNNGLEELLKRYGVDVPNEYTLRVPDGLLPDPRSVKAAPRETENVLAKKFAGRVIYMVRSARVVRPGEARGKYKAETVLQLEYNDAQERYPIVEKNVKLITNLQNLKDLFKNEARLEQAIKRESVPVAVGVTDPLGKPRIVVFGDTEFITNGELRFSPTRSNNYDFTVSAIEWLSERENVGAGAGYKTTEGFFIDSEADPWDMTRLPLWLMLLTVVGTGVAVWLVRRALGLRLRFRL